MKQFVETSVKEQVVITNLKQTALYFLDAMSQNDYESANLEIVELQFSIKRLKELELKRKKREMLVSLVVDMKQRGINIDFAGCSSLFKNSAKNAGEKSLYNSEIHKKKQQA